MKKILAGLMAFGMSICVFSCSDNKKTDDVPEESPTQEKNIEEIYPEIAESLKNYISDGDYDGLLELYYPFDVLETAKTIAEIEGVDYLEYSELYEMYDDSDIADIHIDEVISVEPLDSEILEEINYDFSGVYALAEYIEKTGIENITPETLYEKYMEDWSVSTTITKGYEIKSTATMTYKNGKTETGLQATSQLYYVDGEGWKIYADE
ncbi:MAG: hypothetical protein K2J32_13245 [Ruminococcus sp.]|nr:hypothetical protein [Ruminococcus sp.]